MNKDVPQLRLPTAALTETQPKHGRPSSIRTFKNAVLRVNAFLVSGPPISRAATLEILEARHRHDMAHFQEAHAQRITELQQGEAAEQSRAASTPY